MIERDDEDGPEVLSFPHGQPGVDEEVVAAVEALLFATGEPLTVPLAADALGLDPTEVRAGLRILEQRRAGAGVVLER
ncbi:MAG: hypothetical protein ABMB14_04425, partial [Myxococcota bacterium]